MGEPIVTKVNTGYELEDLTGTTVGRFVIQRRLGTGGMGEVYQADDTRLKRPVALKRLAPRLRNDPHYKDQLLKEAERASALNHSSVARVYDVLEERDELFVVMEYVEGETLRKQIGRPWDTETFLPMATQAADALAGAHEKGIIHRDVKPENIMLGPDGTVKILDFGIARRLPESADGSAITETDPGLFGSFAGTLAYMAPEALLERTGDARSDIFSLGVVFHEVLTGKHPFRSPGYAATVDRILHQTPPAVSQTNTTVVGEVDQIVSKMLAKDPRDRYATTRDLLSDLRELERTSADGALRTRPAPAKAIGISIRAKVAMTVGALLAVAGAVLLVRIIWPPAAPPVPYLAVQTFENQTADPQMDYFSRGMTDTLIARLGGLPGLYAFPLAEDQMTPLVLEGGVQKSGGEVRITYGLRDKENNRNLGGGVVQGAEDDIFSLQDQVAEDVARLLRAELNLAANYVSPPPPTQDVTAYDLYLQGRDYLKRYETPENVETAIGLFQNALDRDPDYALALAGLGEAYLLRYGDTREAQWVDRSLEASRRALELDANSSAGHTALGNVLKERGEYDEAVGEFLRAIELDATSEAAHRGLGAALEALGEPEDAEQIYRWAIKLHPRYWAGYNHLGVLYYRLARYEEAAAMFQTVVELTPDNARGHSNLGAMYQSMSRYDEAVAAYRRSLDIRLTADAFSNLGLSEYYLHRFEQAARSFEKAAELEPGSYRIRGNLADAYRFVPGGNRKSVSSYPQAIALAEKELAVNPRDGYVLSGLALYHAKIGKPAEAKAYMTRARELAPDNPEVLFEAAIVRALAGELESSVLLLGDAVAAGYPVDVLRKEPELDPLRDIKGFRELIGRPGDS